MDRFAQLDFFRRHPRLTLDLAQVSLELASFLIGSIQSTQTDLIIYWIDLIENETDLIADWIHPIKNEANSRRDLKQFYLMVLTNYIL